MPNIIVISVFINSELYSACVTGNPLLIENDNIDLIGIDNSIENLSISKRYNEFLESYDYSKQAWFVFCHSDWEVKEDIEKLLDQLDKTCIYGPIGAILHKNEDGTLTREYRGQCFERMRDGSNLRQQRCKIIESGALVDTLDCQCLIVHSTLVNKNTLRFDEELGFNLYVEDFCIKAKEVFSIESRIINLNCCHWNQADSMDGREDYFVDLNYCNKKYPDKIYAGVVTLIGSGSNKFTKFKNILPEILKMEKTDNSRSTIYKVDSVLPDAKNDSKSIIFRYVTPESTVLDVGCACGDLGIALKKYKDCIVHGLEYDHESIAIARDSCCYKDVQQVDLNFLIDNQYPEFDKKFDWIIFGDVLEHVYDPEAVLRKMCSYLKENGRFLISLPNLAHANIKAGLLLDEFNYTDVGILDKTHIRFFTHKSIPDFLSKNLLKIEDFEFTVAEAKEFDKINPYPLLSSSVNKSIYQSPHSFVVQYVMKVQYVPSEKYEDCLASNKLLSILDTKKNPLLEIYREKAFSTYTLKKSTLGALVFYCANQLIERFRILTALHLSLVKIITMFLLIPASIAYSKGFKNWILGLSRGKSFFSEIIEEREFILKNKNNSFKNKIIEVTLNRAFLLYQTKSIFNALRIKKNR